MEKINKINRDVVTEIEKRGYLGKDEILLLVGSRQAGKTTILKLLRDKLEAEGVSNFFLNLEDPDYLRLLDQTPKNLLQIFPINLKKRSVVFVDEVQYLNDPTNFLKYFYDEYWGKIKLVVSGSSAFYLDRKFKDSLTGRKVILPVRTLSFRELLRFKGENALLELLPTGLTSDNYRLEEETSLSEREKIREYFIEFLTFGGYPRVVLSPFAEKPEILQELACSYIKKDIHEANIRQDEVFYQLFKVLASQIGGLVNINELANTLGVSRKAVDNYLYVMQKSLHICLLRPFYRNMRKELRRMPKVYFYDLGLRNFFVNEFKSPLTRFDRGQLLENAVFRQLAERAGMLVGDKLKYWRIQGGAEVDFVWEESQAFEVKFSTRLFRGKKYKPFLKSYPEIKFNIASLEEVDGVGYPVWKPWWL